MFKKEYRRLLLVNKSSVTSMQSLITSTCVFKPTSKVSLLKYRATCKYISLAKHDYSYLKKNMKRTTFYVLPFGIPGGNERHLLTFIVCLYCILRF